MNNYVKTLPVTGGVGLGLAMQFRVLAIIFLVTTVVAGSIHYFWRRGKTIGQ